MLLDQDYFTFLGEVKDLIRQAQIRASRVVNTEMITLYWDIGRVIVEK